MRRWFLSYNSSDRALAEGLKASIERKDAGSRVFFDATSLRAGGYWQPALAREINEADAFVLLVGEKGLGPWQRLEYYEAHDKHVKSPDDRARDPLPRRRDSLYNGEWRMRQNAALAHLGTQSSCSPSLAGQARQRRKSIARRFLPP